MTVMNESLLEQRWVLRPLDSVVTHTTNTDPKTLSPVCNTVREAAVDDLIHSVR